MATSAAGAGASEAAIMDQGGWRTVQIARRYVRAGQVFRVASALGLGLWAFGGEGVRITKITGPDGRVTTIRSTSSYGCLTALAAVVVLFGPAAWFGTTGAILAYVALGVIVLGAVGYQLTQARRR